MTDAVEIRWGIIGTANIARSQFLPGLRQAGGVAAAVASRDGQRAARYAVEHGIERAIEGYQAIIDDGAIDALYIALPNSLHAEWTISALRAGVPVLCEKPLTGALAETERVLEVASQTGTPLWEAFVFPFHQQLSQVRQLLADGEIGELREIQSDFHFGPLSRPENIRLSAGLDGGALLDVGCYPVRLAQELFGADHQSVLAAAEPAGPGPAGRPDGQVDMETWGIVGYPGGRRLLLSCGMRRSDDTFSRLLGTAGQVELTNPFHPGPADQYLVRVAGQEPRACPAAVPGERSFTAAIRHINAVIRGEQEPRLLATQTSLPTARALHDIAAAAGQAADSNSPPGEIGCED